MLVAKLSALVPFRKPQAPKPTRATITTASEPVLPIAPTSRYHLNRTNFHPNFWFQFLNLIFG
ncbi:hypothetical protein [Curvibacter phage PCA1]|nr:hypothetical protein [Curvibacter phage PCA1]